MQAVESDYNRQLARLQTKALSKLEDLLANARSFSETARALSLIARLKPQRPDPDTPSPPGATTPALRGEGGSAQGAANSSERASISHTATLQPHPAAALPPPQNTPLSATAHLLARAGQSLLSPHTAPPPLTARATALHPPAG